MLDLLVRGGIVVRPEGAAPADVGVRDGRIVRVGAISEPADEVLDARGLHVLPGAVDAHVHLREPGMEEAEDLASGTAAAVLGGVTAVLDMPNNRPPTTSAAALEDKLARARGRARCDVGFFVGATADNVADLPELERLPGVAGVKVFMGSSTGDLLVADDATLRAVLAAGRRRVAVHAEDEERLRARRPIAEAEAHPRAHHRWRDARTALRAARRLLRAARAVGRPVHLLHLSTTGEVALLARNRDLATAEVTPHHLLLRAPGDLERLGSRAQVNPPVRPDAHRRALWRALRDGLVDLVASDHAPHPPERKALPYPRCPSGMPGVGTLLPLLLDRALAGALPLEALPRLLGEGPARTWGIEGKGRIYEGFDADLVLVDLAGSWTVRAAELPTRCGWTAFEGRRLRGRVVATVLRGRLVAREGELVGPPAGRPLRFRAERGPPPYSQPSAVQVKLAAPSQE